MKNKYADARRYLFYTAERFPFEEICILFRSCAEDNKNRKIFGTFHNGADLLISGLRFKKMLQFQIIWYANKNWTEILGSPLNLYLLVITIYKQQFRQLRVYSEYLVFLYRIFAARNKMPVTVVEIVTKCSHLWLFCYSLINLNVKFHNKRSTKCRCVHTFNTLRQITVSSLMVSDEIMHESRVVGFCSIILFPWNNVCVRVFRLWYIVLHIDDSSSACVYSRNSIFQKPIEKDLNTKDIDFVEASIRRIVVLSKHFNTERNTYVSQVDVNNQNILFNSLPLKYTI